MLVVVVAALFVGCLHAPVTSSSGAAASATSGLTPAQTPPTSLGCATVNTVGSLSIVSPTGGFFGEVVGLADSGFTPGDSVFIYLANDSGGEVSSELGFFDPGQTSASVNVPARYSGPYPPGPGDYAPGSYYFWGEDSDGNCANSSAFDMTAVPPATFDCSAVKINPTLTIVSPSPPSGSAGSVVELSGSGF